MDGALHGSTPAQPDFALLRAGLTAAQATTPTAQASDLAQPAEDRADALARLFGTQAGATPPGTALRGSFNPELASSRDGECQK